MFYKEGYLNEKEKQLLLDYSFELACVLKDIYKQSLEFKDADFRLLEMHSKKENQCRFALQIDNDLFNPINLSFNNINNRNLNERNKIVLSKKEFDDNPNQDAVQRIKSIIGANFFKVFHIPSFKALDGKTYRAEYISNCDPNILSFLVVDKINVFNENDKQVGYLKVKYTSPNIISKLRERNIIKSIDKPFIELFSNVASTEYVKFNSVGFGDHSGKGLAAFAYLEMAKLLNKKGISFRSSVLQSDTALNFWNRLRKNFPNFIQDVRLDSGDTVYILKPLKNYQFKIELDEGKTKRKRLKT